jgi:hypothetical protein
MLCNRPLFRGYHFSSWFPLFILVVVSSCTIDNYGATAARISKSESALVFDVYAIGGQLRTRADDAGLSLGYTKRSYVFAPPSDGGPSEGWHYFHVPLPDQPAVALNLTTVGLDLRAVRSAVGLALGYRASTILAQVDRDSHVVLVIRYKPSEPEITRLHYCEGRTECFAVP